MSGRERAPSELIKRGYSEDEIATIYELGRLHLETGNLKRAEFIFHGLTEILPEFAPGWLGMCYVHIHARDYDLAIYCANQSLRAAPHMTEPLLFLIACLLTTGDYNSAGTYLGEVGDKIQTGLEDRPSIVRFFRAQMARYQYRPEQR